MTETLVTARCLMCCQYVQVTERARDEGECFVCWACLGDVNWYGLEIDCEELDCAWKDA